MLKNDGLESSSDNLYQSWRDILLNCQKTTRKTIVLTSGVNPYAGGQFYGWKKPKDTEETTDLSQVTDKPYHLMLYTSP
jgi:hypothetical protein